MTRSTRTVAAPRHIGAALATGMAALIAAAPAPSPAAEYSFAIVPQQSATRLLQTWGPVLAHVGETTGHSLRFATAKDIPAFEACLAAEAYDAAYMNPYHYTVFHARGYRAFAKQQGKKLKGLIVVRADNAAASLAELDGETFAFPSPAAFGASVLPRAEMTGQGIAFTPQYVRSHDSVYRAVLAGLMPAGGGVLRTFSSQSEETRAGLRVIYETDAYTPHAFAFHGSVPSEVQTAIAEAFTALGDTAPELLQPIRMKGIEAAADADWNDVRALGLSQGQTEIVSDGSLQCLSD